MRKIIITVLLSFLFIFLRTKPSLAIVDPLSTANNIFGMGIVNTTDLQDVKNLVNSNGGQWGYVKVVITENDRNQKSWQDFLDNCRRSKIIPIVRIATKYNQNQDYWEKPQLEEIDNWASFLDSLNWVTKNRYVIVGNEPNHGKEWGGNISPEEYAKYLREFSIKLKQKNNDFFILNAGLDQDAPNSKITMDQKDFLTRMVKYDPDIINFVDGWNSHSYPNPGFSGSPTDTGKGSIRGYEWELEHLRFLGVAKKMPIFITETGWVIKNNNQDLVAKNYKYAFEKVWLKNNQIVAVTPFILNYQQMPFADFSWKVEGDNFLPMYREIQNIAKVNASPSLKVKGEVVFNFLNPFGARNSITGGYALVKNTGEAIWYDNDINITEQNSKLKLVNIKMDNIEPMKTGLVTYRLIYPDSKGISEINLGLYVMEEKVGQVFSGKIISF